MAYSFLSGKIVQLTLVGEEGYILGRVLKEEIFLDQAFLLFVPDGEKYGEYISGGLVARIRVVGIVPEKEIPELPGLKDAVKKRKIKVRRGAR